MGMGTDDGFFQPVSGFDLPRFAGIPTFMRLPHVGFDHPRFAEVQIGLIGAPWDGGTTNRPGPRHGPRQLRDLSTMIRAQNGATWVAPFDLARCADLGDVAPNPADLMDTMARMEAFYTRVRAAGILPLTGGGDHLCTLPILRALGKGRPLGMIQFDSHTDLNDIYFGTSRYNHGTPFRRAVEEGLLDPKTLCDHRDPWHGLWARGLGLCGLCWDHGSFRLPSSMRGGRGCDGEAREIVGQGETYVTYDIDFVDPTFAPGTGTPEVGGPKSWQALQVARGLRGVNVVGADLVEVSPPFDASRAGRRGLGHPDVRDAVRDG